MLLIQAGFRDGEKGWTIGVDSQPLDVHGRAYFQLTRTAKGGLHFRRMSHKRHDEQHLLKLIELGLRLNIMNDVVFWSKKLRKLREKKARSYVKFRRDIEKGII